MLGTADGVAREAQGGGPPRSPDSPSGAPAKGSHLGGQEVVAEHGAARNCFSGPEGFQNQAKQALAAKRGKVASFEI